MPLAGSRESKLQGKKTGGGCLQQNSVIVTGFECLATFSAVLPELVSNLFMSGSR